MKKNELEYVISAIKSNRELMDVLVFISTLHLPNYYIAAGAVFQTVWNYQDQVDLNYGIKDIDVIYYDNSNLSVDKDLDYYKKIKDYVDSRGYSYDVDVSNEARMHLWKEEKEGKKVLPYQSSEDAIRRWIATVHAIGVTYENNEVKVFAPYGVSDIVNRVIRPIKHEGNNPDLYYKKVNGWKKRFSKLTIIDW